MLIWLKIIDYLHFYKTYNSIVLHLHHEDNQNSHRIYVDHRYIKIGPIHHALDKQNDPFHFLNLDILLIDQKTKKKKTKRKKTNTKK